MVPKIIFLWHIAHGCLVCLLCLCLFRLCIHVIYSGYSLMLSIQAIHSCYLFRLFIHAIYSGYSFRLSIQAIHSGHISFGSKRNFEFFQVLGHTSFGSKRIFDFLRKHFFQRSLKTVFWQRIRNLRKISCRSVPWVYSEVLSGSSYGSTKVKLEFWSQCKVLCFGR